MNLWAILRRSPHARSARRGPRRTRAASASSSSTTAAGCSSGRMPAPTSLRGTCDASPSSAPRTPFRVDAYKVAHHGSENNTSNDLLSTIACPAYLFSTNGRQGFCHPHEPAIARIVLNQPNARLEFNTESDASPAMARSDAPGRRSGIRAGLPRRPRKSGDCDPPDVIGPDRSARRISASRVGTAPRPATATMVSRTIATER